MTPRKITRRILVATLLIMLASCGPTATTPHTRALPAPAEGEPITCGVGMSRLIAAHDAGVEAARQARDALKGAPPRLVLVFDSVEDHAAMLKGVASVFDPAIIVGCSTYGAITPAGNDGAVGVMAISGVSAQVAVAPVLNDDYRACGESLGGLLKGATSARPARKQPTAEPRAPAPIDVIPGELLIMFGKCHTNANDALVLGVRHALGDNLAMVGVAAARDEVVYENGRVLQQCNLGVVVRGKFTTRQNTRKGEDKAGILETARSSLLDAIGSDAARIAGVLAFDCQGRMNVLADDLPQEMAAMKLPLGDLPLLGCYGSGEIGPLEPGQPARGVGFHIATCAIIRDE